MKELLDRFVALERRLSHQRGAFSLFALFLRKDAQDKWDLVLAAPWMDENRRDALAYVADHVQADFRPEELLEISRIVIVDQDNPALDALNRAIRVEHGAVEVQDSEFFGLPVKHAYIITSQGLNEAVHAVAA